MIDLATAVAPFLAGGGIGALVGAATGYYTARADTKGASDGTE